RTPTEVRRALVYVLGNARKHLASLGYKLSPSYMDEYSSAAWFTGWSVPPPRPAAEPPVAPARTWLLTTGWRDKARGPLRRDEMPDTCPTEPPSPARAARARGPFASRARSPSRTPPAPVRAPGAPARAGRARGRPRRGGTTPSPARGDPARAP